MYLATLRYLKSGLEQFAVDTRRSPKWVLDAHSPDQSAQLRVDLRPPSNQARLPTPVPTKSGPMPTQERLGMDDGDDLQHRWKPSIQLDKGQAIAVGKADATSDLAPQNNQLISERGVLCLKPDLRLEWRDQDGQENITARSFMR
jgi:hypothetical protein